MWVGMKEEIEHNSAQILVSFVNTMTDQCKVNLTFFKEFFAVHDKALPKVLGEKLWDSLGSEDKARYMDVQHFFFAKCIY